MSNPVVAQPPAQARTGCSRCRHCGVVAGVPLKRPVGGTDFFIAVGACWFQHREWGPDPADAGRHGGLRLGAPWSV